MSELKALLIGTGLLVVSGIAAAWLLAASLGFGALGALVVFVIALVILYRAFMKYQWTEAKTYAKWVMEKIRESERNRK